MEMVPHADRERRVRSATILADAASLLKEDIFDLEKAYVESVAAVERDDRSGHFHPSAVGMCARRNVYEFNAAPAISTIDPADQEIFDMGHAVHDIVQGKMAKLGTKGSAVRYEFAPEVPYDEKTDTLYKEYGLGGTCDGTLRIWLPGVWEQRGILEVKSMKDSLFEKLRSPKADHLMQTHLYAYRFNCPLMWIWYYNKNTSKRLVFPVVFDDYIFEEALRRFNDQLLHVQAGTLPERDESWYMCPRCAYRDDCDPPINAKVRGRARSSGNGKKVSHMRKATMKRLTVINGGERWES